MEMLLLLLGCLVVTSASITEKVKLKTFWGVGGWGESVCQTYMEPRNYIYLPGDMNIISDLMRESEHSLRFSSKNL